VGIGYVAKQPAGSAQAWYSSAAGGVLPSVPEGEVALFNFMWAPIYTGVSQYQGG
jgi:hypothetical protein